MDYATLYSRSVSELRALAKKQGVKIPSGTTKMHMIQMMLDADAEANAKNAATEKINEKTIGAAENDKGTPTVNEDKTETAAVTEKATDADPDTEKATPVKPKRAASRAKKSNTKDAAAETKKVKVSDEMKAASDEKVQAEAQPVKKTSKAGAKPVRKNTAKKRGTVNNDTAAADETKANGDTSATEKTDAAAYSTPIRVKADTASDGKPTSIKKDAETDGKAAQTENAADSAPTSAKTENAADSMPISSKTDAAAESKTSIDEQVAEAARNAMKAYNAKRSTDARANTIVRTARTTVNKTPAANNAGLGAQNTNRDDNAVKSKGTDTRAASAPKASVRADEPAPLTASTDDHAENRQENTANRITPMYAENRAENTANRVVPTYTENRQENTANRVAPTYTENRQESTANRTASTMPRASAQPFRKTTATENVTSSYLMQAKQASNIVTPGAKQEQPRFQRREFVPQDPAEVKQAVSDMLTGGDIQAGGGVLELMPDGYGFLRAHNCQPGPNDAYLSAAQIRRFNLRQGDYVTGRTRPQREGDRYMAMLYIDTVNGDPADKAIGRPKFEDLVPVFPTDRLIMERKDDESDLSLRIIDLLAPIGRGQRALVVSQPKAGKTVLLKKIANAITVNAPDVTLIMLLIDERPEEVTDMQRSIQGEVVYSTFDEIPENHAHVSEMVLERAKRLVEQGKDVVILLDSITRLARAYNLVIPPTGRTLSGGIDPGSLHKPKRFFGAARNIENGGSLTIIATALVETGSRADDIIYEEFKGTGNSEIHLDRKLSERRIFPAIDMKGSGTRREEMLLTPEEMECALSIRRLLSNASDDAEQLLALMEKTPNNEEFCRRMKAWMVSLGKNGYNF